MANSKKDAFYFTHDSNARNDIKILKLRKDMKLEGYAIYFMLIEVLREQKDHRLLMDSISDLSFDFRAPEERIIKVIKNYDLFTVDTHNFFSERLTRSMFEYNEKKAHKSEAGKKGMSTRWGKSDDGLNGEKKMIL